MENKEIHEMLVEENRPDRCVMVMNDAVEGGYLANAIAVIAQTVGQRHPYFVGTPLVDASGVSHPGLIPIGIPMLKCNKEQLAELRTKALEKGCDVVDFPIQGQQTKNYGEFLDMMTKGVQGYSRAVVNRITKHCDMIR